MSYYLDHQLLQARRPEQLPYTKTIGTNSTMTPAQRNHILESQDPTSTSSTEKASHQTTKPQSNTQTKNLSYQDRNHPNQAKTKYPHKPAHLSLMRISAGLPHHQMRTPPPEPDTKDLHHQTNIALASLLFTKNNNRPQQIWQLRLLRLQQQQLLSALAPHQRTPPRQHPRVTLDLNESLVIYTTPCAETHQPLEDLEGLEDLADLEDQECLKDPLQQYLRQPQQEEMLMTGLWGTSPKYLMGNEGTPGHSSIPYSDTSEPTPEYQASTHPYTMYPSRSPSSRDPK
jgi:hypothetical protein